MNKTRDSMGWFTASRKKNTASTGGRSFPSHIWVWWQLMFCRSKACPLSAHRKRRDACDASRDARFVSALKSLPALVASHFSRSFAPG